MSLLSLLLHGSCLVLFCSAQDLPLPSAPNVDVVLGQRAELVCRLEGYTGSGIPTLSITKVSGSISNSMLNDEGTMLTLSILQARTSDEGTYVCFAQLSSEQQEQTTYFNLTVAKFGFISRPMNTIASPGSSPSFQCSTNIGEAFFWTKNGSVRILLDNPRFNISVIQSVTVLTVVNVTYLDNGTYTCIFMDSGTTIAATAMLILSPAYVPLGREGSAGQSQINTNDQLRVRCPLEGVPGPTILYWQKGLARDSPNITAPDGSGNDPFVDSDRYLDFSTATSDDDGSYRCTGVDPYGIKASQTFYVEVVHRSSVILWKEWHIILVYCVVGVVILGALILFFWFCCSVRHIWCVRAKKIVKEKIHVRRPRPLVTKTALPEDYGIDDYAIKEGTEDQEV